MFTRKELVAYNRVWHVTRFEGGYTEVEPTSQGDDCEVTVSSEDGQRWRLTVWRLNGRHVRDHTGLPMKFDKALAAANRKLERATT